MSTLLGRLQKKFAPETSSPASRMLARFKTTDSSATTTSAPLSQSSPLSLKESTEPIQPSPRLSFGSSARPVGNSRDLERILEIPRRTRPSDEELAQLSQKWTAKLGKGQVVCNCASYKRTCPYPLLPVQAWALEEISLYGGLLGPIGVGDGKTLLDLLSAMVLPDCERVVLLVQASLREQLVEIDWEFYAQHWKLPNRAGGRWLLPGVPVVHVLAYSELSGASNTARLTEINPDTIIADEAQALRNLKTARGKRFKRYMEASKPRLCAWSGTLTSKAMEDYAHFSEYALREGSPVPSHYPTLVEWAGALDPVELGEMPTPPGELMRLCAPGEYLMDAWQRRLCETPGVVSSPETGNCKAALYISERKVKAPQSIIDATEKLAATWERPDGERLITGLDMSRCQKELASGFYNLWRWPKNEPLPVRKRWIDVRKAWHKELSEKLKTSREFMDSPLLLTKAAIRWFDGYVHIERIATGHKHDEDGCYEGEGHDRRLVCEEEEEKEGRRLEIPPFTKRGPMPTWESTQWQEWKEVRNTAEPETYAEWLDPFLAQDAANWLTEGVGICWYEHVAFGEMVTKLSRCASFGPGEEASRGILKERGERSIVASIKSHGTGKNLQPFSRNLVANLPSDGATWEQLVGRTHRTGQMADEITVEIYRHMPVVRDAFSKALTLASHIKGTFGGSQKLLKATRLGGI